MSAIYPLGVSVRKRQEQSWHRRSRTPTSARSADRSGVHRSGLRHDGRSAHRRSTGTAITAAPIISARPAAAPSSPPIRDKYLAGRRAPAEPVPEGTIYTCPMHPQIRQVGPGACPICGMALEPELATAETGPNPELVDMTRRFWIGLVLTLPVFVLEMGAHLVGAHGLVDQTLSNWMQFALRDAGRAVGRLAVLRARLAVAGHAQPQHVHADRDGHRRRLRSTAWSRRLRPASSRRPSAAMTARSRSISRPPPSSPCWCCSARCWSCARASRPRAPSARCSISRPRPRAASATTAATRRSRSTRSRSATGCACGRARRCRSTAR